MTSKYISCIHFFPSCRYLFASIASFIYESVTYDPGRVVYRYDSIPGYLFVTLKFLGWFWFSYAVLFTVKHYPEKRSFYLPFYLFYTIWFLAMPITIVLCQVRNFVSSAILPRVDLSGGQTIAQTDEKEPIREI